MLNLTLQSFISVFHSLSFFLLFSSDFLLFFVSFTVQYTTFFLESIHSFFLLLFILATFLSPPPSFLSDIIV